MSQNSDNRAARGILGSLTISVGLAALCALYYIFDFPMFDITIWLWIGAISLAAAVAAGTSGFLWLIWKNYPVTQGE
jgi:hypothetical protein